MDLETTRHPAAGCPRRRIFSVAGPLFWFTMFLESGNEAKRSVSREALLFRGSELLKTAGWLILDR